MQTGQSALWDRSRAGLAQLLARASLPRHLTGAALFRIVAGTNILLNYLLNYHQRQFLFGPHAAVSYADFAQNLRGFSLYAGSPEPWFFELVYHTGMLIAALWLLGVRTTWLTPLNYVFWYSLYQRNPLLWDGGDNIMALMFVYAFFMQLDARLALLPAPVARPAPVRAVLHNLGVLACVTQLCVVYSVSGLSKVQGETWRQGTALYYPLGSVEFSLPGVSELLYQNAALLVLVCYVTVFFLVGFPFMVFLNPWSRRLAFVMAFAFHVGIGLFMGLVSFAVFMLAAELMVLDDAEYAALRAFFARCQARLRAHWAARARFTRQVTRSS